MATNRLDSVDRGILHLLQQDARNLTPVDMARRLPVSDGTVRNRIGRMEDDGIIEGYVPTLNYEAAGFPLTTVFTCTAPVDRAAELVDAAVDVDRVVSVRELVASRGNVEVVCVASDLDEVVAVASDLVDLGLEIDRQRLVRDERVRPFDEFGADAIESE